MPFLYQYATVPWIVAISPFPRWFVLMAVAGSIVAVLSLFTYAVVERPFVVLGRGKPTSPAVRSSVTTENDRVEAAKADANVLVSTDHVRT
jgi:hypothetical protein